MKKKMSQNSLANLRPRKGGVPPGEKVAAPNKRELLSYEEMEVCAEFARTGRPYEAGRHWGISRSAVQKMLTRDTVMAQVREFQDTYKKDLVQRSMERAEQRREVLHAEFIARLPEANSAEWFRVGFQSVGEIDSGRFHFSQNSQVNNGNTGAPQPVNIYAKRLYLPEWRREVIDKLQANDERIASGIEVPAAERGTVQAGE